MSCTSDCVVRYVMYIRLCKVRDVMYIRLCKVRDVMYIRLCGKVCHVHQIV